MKRIKGYFKKLWKTLGKAEMGILPATLAYYFVLAIIPILTIIVLIASKFSISLDYVVELINEFFPQKVAFTIIEAISGKGFDTSMGIFNIFAFVIASNGMYAIIMVANNLYKIKKYDVVKERIKSIFLLIDLIALIMFLLIVPMFGEKILFLLKTNKILSTSLIGQISSVYKIFKWPITFLMIYCNLKLIYTLSPSKKILSKETTKGAFFATILLIIVTLILSYYLNKFARYDVLYGNLANLIILMIWMYAISYVFVFGIVINIISYENKEENINNNLDNVNNKKEIQ